MNQLNKIRSLLTDKMPAVLLTGAPNRQYATGAIIDEGMCLVTAIGRCGAGDGGQRGKALYRLHPGRPR